jgi:MGT family glycosyltransferase
MTAGRFLLATIDGGGTVPPEMALATELVRRGHSVHVLADPTVRSSAVATGCGFTPWPTAPSIASIADQTAQIRRLEHGPPWRRFAELRDGLIAGPAGRFASDVVATARAQHSDVVLAEALPGILLGALASNRPVAALMPNIYFRPTSGMPPMGTGWLPGNNPLIRWRNTLAGKALSRVMNVFLPAINEAGAAHGVARLAGVFELFDRCDRILVMTSPSFDVGHNVLPANVRYTGPMLDDPTWAGVEWSRDGLRSTGDAPLVLVAMSSIFQNQLGTLRRVASALGRLPVRAVVTTGRAVDPDQVPAPPNVHVLTAAPHAQILQEAAVVVTHAGHGTVIKALAAGVPLVCLPQGRDQKDNAARVRHLGVGVSIGKRANEQSIEAAVNTVLSDHRYRNAALRFAARLRDEATHAPSAADEAESMLARNR